MKITDLKEYTVVSPTPEVKQKIQKSEKTGFQKVLDVGTKVSNFVGAKGIADEFGATGAEASLRLKGQKSAAQNVDYPSGREVLGSAVQTGAWLLPGAGSTAKLGTKVLAGTGTGYAYDVGSKLQNKDKTIPQVLTPGVGTAVGATLPVAVEGVKLASRVISRLFKGLGSGVSGVPQDTIEKIVTNPKVADKASKKLAEKGNARILEENSRQIMNGVTKIRGEASKAFREGLDQLSATDIQPTTFRQQTQAVLDKYGVQTSPKGMELTMVEFSEPKNISKAQELIKKLQTVELDGKSLRKLADDIDSSIYRVANSDERLSYNFFAKDLANSLKSAITKSTDKLTSINAAYSADMQLVEAIEDIFGNVNFKNLPEVLRASQKLEGLATQKGLAPDVVDKFLTRIGIIPMDFRTVEAVRSISNKVSGMNTKGLSVGELVQALTSSIVTPQTVKNLSIKTGLGIERLRPFLVALKEMNPIVQKAILNALVSSQDPQEELQ